MIRIVLAIVGGAIASVVVWLVETPENVPSFLQLMVMLGVIALILLLTGWRFSKTGGQAEELLSQLMHHRRELHRLLGRYQRQGALTAAEASAWFRNKRTLGYVKKQLQHANVPYQADAIDTASPPPMGLLTRVKEFVRQPAVSLFIFFFLVSFLLAYPLSVAAQSILENYFISTSTRGQAADLDPGLAAATTPTATSLLPSRTQTPALAEQPTAPASPTPTTTVTAVVATRTPSLTPTATSTDTVQAVPTASKTPTPTATVTHTLPATNTATPAGILATPLPTLTATPTFLPVTSLPPDCDDATWEVEPNNSFETAQGPLRSGAVYCGYLDDAYDFYYVEVPAPGKLTVSLENGEMAPGVPPFNLLKLFTARMAPIDWCCINQRHHIELTIDVYFGRYYILVDARDIVGIPYILRTQYEPAPP